MGPGMAISTNHFVDNGQVPSESCSVCSSQGVLDSKTLQDTKLCFGADSSVVLQMITGQTKLVKVHTHVVEPTSNKMFQVRFML